MDPLDRVDIAAISALIYWEGHFEQLNLDLNFVIWFLIFQSGKKIAACMSPMKLIVVRKQSICALPYSLLGGGLGKTDWRLIPSLVFARFRGKN